MVKRKKKPMKLQKKQKKSFGTTKAPGTFYDPYGPERVNSDEILDDYFEELVEEVDEADQYLIDEYNSAGIDEVG